MIKVIIFECFNKIIVEIADIFYPMNFDMIITMTIHNYFKIGYFIENFKMIVTVIMIMIILYDSIFNLIITINVLKEFILILAIIMSLTINMIMIFLH